MKERKRIHRNALERHCLERFLKRLFINFPKDVFKMLERIKRS